MHNLLASTSGPDHFRIFKNQKIECTLLRSSIENAVLTDVTKYYSISPSNATETSCKYESSNNHIITVDDKGNIKAIARGEATITVKSIDGKYSCEIKVNVKDITDFIKTTYIGGSIFSLNGLIQYGSQLSWRFINCSSKTVKFVSMQLVDGVTGKEGNEMSVNKDVPPNQYLAYNITIGLLGIHEPVSCRFKYEVDGKTYISTATYSSGF